MSKTSTSTAPGWEKWNGHYRATFMPVFDWLCRAAEVGPDMTVLDIATGCGWPAIPAAERVGPKGRVIATDAAGDMLAAAGRFAKAAGVAERIELREMDMNALAFDDSAFDAVTYAFALMFSPDPVKVMTSVHRVLKPGARFGLSVWDEPAKNPFFTTVFGAMAEVTSKPPPTAGAPGPFRLAAPGELARVLDAAGFTDVRIEPLPIVTEYASVDEHWEQFHDMALKNAVAAMEPADAARLRTKIAENVAPYLEGGLLRMPATPLCATGKKT